MPEHLYKVGEAVTLHSQTGAALQRIGAYIIKARLPPLGDEPQYRIQSPYEVFERVVRECQLSRATPHPEMGVRMERPHSRRPLSGRAGRAPGSNVVKDDSGIDSSSIAGSADRGWRRLGCRSGARVPIELIVRWRAPPRPRRDVPA